MKQSDLVLDRDNSKALAEDLVKFYEFFNGDLGKKLLKIIYIFTLREVNPKKLDPLELAFYEGKRDLLKQILDFSNEETREYLLSRIAENTKISSE